MKTVLITGSGGQLGRTLQGVAANYPGIAPVFLNRGELDITNPEDIEQLFSEIRPDICINCAAYTRVDDAEKYPEAAYRVNAESAELLARACLRWQTFLIHISTDYVFDGERDAPYLPGDAPNPINVYGQTKLEGENRIRRLMERYMIVRTSWLYSPDYGPNFYTKIRDAALRGEELFVTEKEKGSPTRATDLARWLLDNISDGPGKPGTYHVAGNKVLSRYEFARDILEAEGLLEKARLHKANNYRTFARRPANSSLAAGT